MSGITKRSITKRSIREARQRQELYQMLFIAKYIEGVHRDVYTEAHEFYNKVKAVNPEVKNLTKTAEFMEKVTPDAVIPRYYAERRRRRSRLVQKDVQTEMVLEIQLLPQPEVSTSPQPEVSTSPQPEVSTSPQPEVSTPLSPEVYEELLNDLKKDPDLWNILNDFPVEDNTEGIDKVVVEDMGTDMFLSNNITPLEQEVEMAS